MIIPDEYKDDYEIMRHYIAGKIAGTSEELTAYFLEHGSLTDTEIMQAMFMLTTTGKHKIVMEECGGLQILAGDHAPKTCVTCSQYDGRTCTAPLPSWASRPLIKLRDSDKMMFHAAGRGWKPIADCPAHTERCHAQS